jgi:Ca-activated chloride channel family protein
MKSWLTLLFCGFIAIVPAQNQGSLVVELLEMKTFTPLVHHHLSIQQDSILRCGSTMANGKYRFNHLPSGPVELIIELNDSISQRTELVIQPNQLHKFTVLVNLQNNHIIAPNGNTFEYHGDGGDWRQRNSELVVDGIMMRGDAKLIEEVQIVSYKVPLISRDGGSSGYTITREDIARMPVRSAQNVASTVGGVNQSEASGELTIRGARTDGNIYFIDGVKVTGDPSIPKSAMQQTRVYTSGIPANYGDVTGGVVEITTKSFRDIPAERRQLERSHYNYRSYANVASDDDYYWNPPNMDRFLPIYENDFLSPLTHPHSTFGLDVDQASWGYVKQAIAHNRPIQRDAIKMEELINAFHYKSIEVPDGELIHVESERLPCWWEPKHELVAIHLKARDVPQDIPRKAHNFVFLIDVSGSMSPDNRLPLLVEGMRKFVETLNENDRVAIVTYAGKSGIHLASTPCSQKRKIIHALNQLKAEGSTNGFGGIQAAYQLAEENYDPEYNNRIILMTDGDFNVGISNPSDLREYVSTKRGKGIYLTALGVGMGNYKNDNLESLAKHGDGNHFYIRSLADIKKVLIDDIGNMYTIARDVKLNVEFNPKLVKNYRLIGYESRILKPRDFADDTKDAGEIGYNHQVIAVYEIEPGKAEDVQNHFTKTSNKLFQNDFAYIKLRYKPMEDSVSVEREYSMSKSVNSTTSELMNLVIAFGLYLRDSEFKGNVTTKMLRERALAYRAKTEEEVELKDLILKAIQEK